MSSPTPGFVRAAPAARTRGALGGSVAIVVALAAVAAGTWLALRPRTPPPRPDGRDAPLRESLSLRDGASRRITLAEPAVIEVALAMPAAASVRASLGLAGPAGPSAVDAPAPETATTWTARGSDRPKRVVALSPGSYVLRLDPEPESGADLGAVGLVVRRLPAR